MIVFASASGNNQRAREHETGTATGVGGKSKRRYGASFQLPTGQKNVLADDLNDRLLTVQNAAILQWPKDDPANAQASANHSSCTPTGPCGDERNIENGRVDPLPGDFMSMLRTAPL
jgi:hypothetical protein